MVEVHHLLKAPKIAECECAIRQGLDHRLFDEVVQVAADGVRPITPSRVVASRAGILNRGALEPTAWTWP